MGNRQDIMINPSINQSLKVQRQIVPRRQVHIRKA